MNDDWRLSIEFEEQGFAHGVSEDLAAGELDHDLEESFGDRVIVTHDGPHLFLYAATREQTEEAEKVVRSLAEENDWHIASSTPGALAPDGARVGRSRQAAAPNRRGDGSPSTSR